MPKADTCQDKKVNIFDYAYVIGKHEILKPVKKEIKAH